MIDRAAFERTLRAAYPTEVVEAWTTGRVAVHLALMRQPYFDAVIARTKSIESRFARTRVAPIGQVAVGDLIIFKLVGQDRFAIGIVHEVVGGSLDTDAWQVIRKRKEQIGVDESYLATKEQSRYFALLSLRQVEAIEPLAVTKRDRRGWVVVQPRQRQPALL